MLVRFKLSPLLPLADHPNSAEATPAGSTNYSTFKLSYPDEEVITFLNSANEYAKRGYPDPATPNQPDEQWPLCLKCAIVDRARQRANISRTDACQSCLDRCASRRTSCLRARPASLRARAPSADDAFTRA